MTGAMTAIGGGIIGGAITTNRVVRFLTTCDWNSILTRILQAYLRDHPQVLRISQSTIRSLNQLLRRLNNLTRMLPPDETTRIPSLKADLTRIGSRITDTKRIHDLIQRLAAANARQAPEAEIDRLVSELQLASDLFRDQDAAAPSLEEGWNEALARAFVLCDELQESLDAWLAAGTDDLETSIRRLVRELEVTANRLLRLSLPDSPS